jgi:hypothetical protein
MMNVACSGEEHTQFLSERQNVKGDLRDEDVIGIILIKYVLKLRYEDVD